MRWLAPFQLVGWKSPTQPFQLLMPRWKSTTVEEHHEARAAPHAAVST